ncbi:hypothetical protein J7K18_00235 [bacterium]|nr:hypothetical protein [bacterium]
MHSKKETLWFATDGTLARLARWLRLFGYNTIVIPNNLPMLLYLSSHQGRLLLTRSQRCAELAGKDAILLSSEQLPEQIAFLKEKIGIETEPIYTRCTRCNATVFPIEKEKIKQLVPPYTYKTHEEFFFCPICRKIYWRGTHEKRVRETLRRFLR